MAIRYAGICELTRKTSLAVCCTTLRSRNTLNLDTVNSHSIVNRSGRTVKLAEVESKLMVTRSDGYGLWVHTFACKEERVGGVRLQQVRVGGVGTSHVKIGVAHDAKTFTEEGNVKSNRRGRNDGQIESKEDIIVRAMANTRINETGA